MPSYELSGIDKQPENGERSGRHALPTSSIHRINLGEVEVDKEDVLVRDKNVASIEEVQSSGTTKGFGKPLSPFAKEYIGMSSEASTNPSASFKASTNWREKPNATTQSEIGGPMHNNELFSTETPALTELQSPVASPAACQAKPTERTVTPAAEFAPETYPRYGTMGHKVSTRPWTPTLPPPYPGRRSCVARIRQPQPGETARTIYIPTGKCGLIIGKGGDLITKFQDESGCRLISCGHESENTDEGLRPVFLIGLPETLPLAESAIWKCINASGDRPPIMTNGNIQAQVPEAQPYWNPEAPIEEQILWMYYLAQYLAAHVGAQEENRFHPVVTALQGAIEYSKTENLASESSSDHGEGKGKGKAIEFEPTNDNKSRNSRTWASTVDPRNFTEYEALEYLPGHYMATDKIRKFMSSFKISGQMKTKDFKELVNLLQDTYSHDSDTMKVLEKLENHMREYYPSEEATNLIDRVRITDLYVPTEEERASYDAILRKAMKQDVQVSTEDLKRCFRASTSEKERLKSICNDLAKWIQLMQNDKDEITRLKRCIHNLKIENFSNNSDIQLEQLRYQYSKNLEEFDNKFEEELNRRLIPTLSKLTESQQDVNASLQRVADLSCTLRDLESEVKKLETERSKNAENLELLRTANISAEVRLAQAESQHTKDQADLEDLHSRVAALERGAKEAAMQIDQRMKNEEKLKEQNSLLERGAKEATTQIDQHMKNEERLKEQNTLLGEDVKLATSQIEKHQQDKQKLEGRIASLVAALKRSKKSFRQKTQQQTEKTALQSVEAS